jgi:thymidine phosphorylase
MSKKIAAGATAVVLDVKVGGGAFLREVEQARELARTMIDLGRDAGRDVRAVVTAMDEPLGLAVGNALEVREAFALLSGGGPADLREVVLTLAGHLLAMAGKDKTLSLARDRAAAHLENGTARETARRWMAAQGGRPDVVDGKGLPQAPFVLELRSDRTGWLQEVAARPIAKACLALGAGRESKGASVDASVGVVLGGGSGTEIAAGEVLASIHARTEQQARAVVTLVRSAFTVGAKQPAARKIILEEIYEGVS